MEKILIIAIVALIFSLSSFFLSLFRTGIQKDLFEIIKILPQLSIENYYKAEKVEVEFNPPSIILYSNCYRLIGYVEDSQAKSINNALQKIREWRPNTHDVVSDIFKEFEIKLIDVRIEEIINNSYIAKAFIFYKNKIREVDIRPSDGIALALRLNSPIYIKKNLLFLGEKIC